MVIAQLDHFGLCPKVVDIPLNAEHMYTFEVALTLGFF